jgi:hypothetical protein
VRFLRPLPTSFSSVAWVPATSVGFFRKSWRSFHSPLPGVPPKACGAWSDMSKRKSSPDAIRDLAIFCCTAFGYAEFGTFLLGER